MIVIPLIPVNAKVYLKAIAGVLVASALFYGGWKLRDLQAKADTADLLKAQAEAISEMEKDRAGREAWLQAESAALRQQKQKIVVKWREYEKPVYRECVLPADGLQPINQAINAANTARHPR